MAIITSITKRSDKDTLLPLNLRGISLNLCVSKISSSIMKRRILSYCEELELLAEEQNGFWSIIRNHISCKKPEYCAFIDLKKAFDWVDRDLLLYALLNFTLYGKVYFAIKVMYTDTFSCLKLITSS